jgi:copper resistance protein D
MMAVAALIQWVALASLMALVGAATLDLFVLPSAVPELVPARRELRRWMGVTVITLGVASIGQLLVRTRTMSGGDLAAIVAAVPSVLTHTHFGAIWIGRFAALAAMAILCPLSSRAARVPTFLLAAGLGLTTSLTGHAADSGDVSLTVLVDYAHVLGATAWMGGLFAFALVMMRSAPAWPDRLPAMVARRFSALAGVCLLVVILSGAYNAWAEVRVWAALWRTTYGQVLLAKLAFVLVVAGVGGVNRFFVLPMFRAALLTETTPARHALRMQDQEHAGMHE